MKQFSASAEVIPHEYLQATKRVFNRVIEGLVAKDAGIGDIRRKSSRHNSTFRVVIGELDHDVNHEYVRVEDEISLEDIRLGHTKLLTDLWIRYSETEALELQSIMLRNLDLITRASGMRVDACGQPASPETLLAMLEMIDIDFDENGSPKAMKIIAPPGLQESIMSQWTLENQESLQAILTAKRKKWEANRRARKLKGNRLNQSCPSSTHTPI